MSERLQSGDVELMVGSVETIDTIKHGEPCVCVTGSIPRPGISFHLELTRSPWVQLCVLQMPNTWMPSSDSPECALWVFALVLWRTGNLSRVFIYTLPLHPKHPGMLFPCSSILWPWTWTTEWMDAVRQSGFRNEKKKKKFHQPTAGSNRFEADFPFKWSNKAAGASTENRTTNEPRNTCYTRNCWPTVGQAVDRCDTEAREFRAVLWKVSTVCKM